MAYSEEQKTNKINLVCESIEKGLSLRQSCLDNDIAPKVFYEWIDNDEEKSKQYARACEDRADLEFEQILLIADDQEDDVYKDKDGLEQTNHNVINRSRLRIDARKWRLSKMQPKKYGDSSTLKLANNDGNELKFNAIFTTDFLDVQTDDGTQEDI